MTRLEKKYWKAIDKCIDNDGKLNLKMLHRAWNLYNDMMMKGYDITTVDHMTNLFERGVDEISLHTYR